METNSLAISIYLIVSPQLSLLWTRPIYWMQVGLDWRRTEDGSAQHNRPAAQTVRTSNARTDSMAVSSWEIGETDSGGIARGPTLLWVPEYDVLATRPTAFSWQGWRLFAKEGFSGPQYLLFVALALVDPVVFLIEAPTPTKAAGVTFWVTQSLVVDAVTVDNTLATCGLIASFVIGQREASMKRGCYMQWWPWEGEEQKQNGKRKAIITRVWYQLMNNHIPHKIIWCLSYYRIPQTLFLFDLGSIASLAFPLDMWSIEMDITVRLDTILSWGKRQDRWRDGSKQITPSVQHASSAEHKQNNPLFCGCPRRTEDFTPEQ